MNRESKAVWPIQLFLCQIQPSNSEFICCSTEYNILRYILKMTAKLPVATSQLLWSGASESCWENVVCVISAVAL